MNFTNRCSKFYCWRPERLGFIGMVILTVISCGHHPVALGQDYEELEVLEEYFTEVLQPIMVDIDDNPVQSIARAARLKELTAFQKRQIDQRNREGKAKITEDSRRVQAMIESGGDLNDELVDRFFAGYVFPEMTRLDNLAELGEARSQFFRLYLGSRVTDSNIRNRFIDQVCLPNLKKVYENQEKNLHPAARLNAVYLLGMLDSAAGSRIGPVAPVPSATALDELIRLAGESDPLLKTGAWAGLLRHLQIDAATGSTQIPGPKKSRIGDLAKGLIQEPANENGSDEDVDYWLKRRSVQALGFLKDSSSLSLLTQILSDPEARFWLKLDALETIGKLDLNQVQKETIESITRFISDSLDAESATIEQELADLIYQNMLYQDLDLELTGTTDWDDPAKTTTGPTGFGGGGGLGAGGLGGGGRGGGLGGGPGGGPGGDRGGSGDPRGGGGMSGDPRGGGGGSGMGLGEGDGLGGMGDFGGLGGGGLGGGGLGGGRGTGRPAATHETVKPELPNYLLQVSRRRIKSLAFVGKQTLMPDMTGSQPKNGLFSAADGEENRDSIKKVSQLLDQLIKDANVGIVNVDPRRATTRRRGAEEEPQKVDETTDTEKMAKLCRDTAAKLRDAVGIEEDSQEENLDQTGDVSAETGKESDQQGG